MGGKPVNGDGDGDVEVNVKMFVLSGDRTVNSA